MTVSPTRPSDGSRQSELSSDQNSGRRREMESSSDSSAMPPVLFNLRNLSPTKPAKPVEHEPITAKTAVASTTAPAINAPPTPAPATPAPATVAHATVAQPMATHSISASAAPEPRREPAATSENQSQASSSSTSRSGESNGQTDDRPAGRTWMEAAVAHRNVLMLLAVVIVVAFWTSRNSSKPSEYETSLVDADEVLEFDSGELMVSSTMEGGSDFGKTSGSQNAVVSNDFKLTDTTKSKTNPKPTQPAAVLNPPESLKSSVKLNDPVSDDGSSGLLNPGVGASTVSSRKFTNSRTPGLPSLEDLATEPSLDLVGETNLNDGKLSDESVIEATESATASFGSLDNFVNEGDSQSPTLSQTPAAVGDWLRFLPPPSNTSASNQ